MAVFQIVIWNDNLRRVEVLRRRERELGYLDARYTSDRAELVVLYGRLRVGKTTLAYHWAQDKPHLFFFATQDDNATLLRRSRQHGLPPVAEVGSWWSRGAQIDVVGVDRHSRSVVFGEARWRQEPFTRRDLERLVERGQLWLQGSDAHWNAHYAVYARHLAPGLRVLGEQERNVHLFTPADVVQGESG